jgi:hypothetical protein
MLASPKRPLASNEINVVSITTCIQIAERQFLYGPRTYQICLECCSAQSESEMGPVSRVTPVQTAMRNCTRDEGRPFKVGNQVLISSHRKLLSSKAMVVNVAETSGQ